MQSTRTTRVAEGAGGVLALLFTANFLNFFDRALPAVLAEPIRLEFGLSDTQIGLVGSAFTVVYAIAGLPLGRLADRLSRKWIIAIGLAIWSLMTGATGLAGSFATLMAVRIGVGIGEAAFAPAANALIADCYPSEGRSKATSLFMMGLPAGIIVAFFSTGAIVAFFGTWRAAFFIAMVPGILVAVWVLRMREPARGYSDTPELAIQTTDKPIRAVLSVPTMWWLSAAGITFNFSSYAVTTFMVPNLQRYFGLSLTMAGISVGVIIGVSGLIGLPICGWLADRLHMAFIRGRLLFGVGCMIVSAGLTFAAMSQPSDAVISFVALFAIGWFLQYAFYSTANPTIHDVLPPSLRATGVAIFFFLFYIFGAAYGSVASGMLSDHLAERAQLAANAPEMTEAFRAIGLHGSLFMIPALSLGTGLFLLIASLRYPKDHRR
ncbi:MFS transporter [Notoacmeibacter ruber]|uniref:MFS transporter n=2 Tax=Notoacmeibacter ruber TaxID=2670375 RepID=A0A3L7JL84_9HYPH|nr:MFS transporter [Notoacmeibacter ruber]